MSKDQLDSLLHDWRECRSKISILKSRCYELNERLGKSLRKRRISAGISLREMGRLLDVSAVFLSDLERGNRIWSEGWIEGYISTIKNREKLTRKGTE